MSAPRTAMLLVAATAACRQPIDLGGAADARPVPDATPAADADPCLALLPCTFPSSAEGTSICGAVHVFLGARTPGVTVRVADAVSYEPLATAAVDLCARFAANDIPVPPSGLASVIVDGDFPTANIVEARSMSLNDGLSVSSISAAQNDAWSTVAGVPSFTGATLVRFVDETGEPVAGVTVYGARYPGVDGALEPFLSATTPSGLALYFTATTVFGAEPTGCVWTLPAVDGPADGFLLVTVKPDC